MYAKTFFSKDSTTLFICLIFEGADSINPNYTLACVEEKCCGEEGRPCTYRMPWHLVEIMWQYCHDKLETNQDILNFIRSNHILGQGYLCDSSRSLISSAVFNKAEDAGIKERLPFCLFSSARDSLFWIYHTICVNALMPITGAPPAHPQYCPIDWEHGFLCIKMVKRQSEKDNDWRTQLFDLTTECPIHMFMSHIEGGPLYMEHPVGNHCMAELNDFVLNYEFDRLLNINQ